MIAKNKTRICVLVFFGSIVTLIVLLTGKIDVLNVLATFSETSSQISPILKVSEFGMSDNSTKIVILAEECRIDPLESELGPNPRLGWTNPRIPGDTNSELECIEASVPSTNSTSDR